jgi:hypothetical protein
MAGMNPVLPRLPLLALGAASLVAGLLAGEWRLGWTVPAADFALYHGPLMVCGFFGTVIGLERAVALNKSWGFLAPLLTAVGGLLLVAGCPAAGTGAMVFGSMVFLGMALAVLRRQREPFTALMALGAACWVAGNAAWFHGADISVVVPAWAAFLVLTIAGERLELSRFLPPSKHRLPTLIPALLVLLAGTALSSWPVFGTGLLLLTLWSLANDIVRRTIRQAGLTRYVAVALLSGYAWLAASGALMLASPLPYDAALHSLFVGFVFAMVFGHAPVILPALLKIRVAFSPLLYLPLALLHAALLARVLGGVLELEPLRAMGGLGNAAAILVFIATMVRAVVRAR